MTTELTKAAQQALELLKAHVESNYCQAHDQEDRDVIAALERALTQRPAAQSEAQALAHNMMLWREDAVHNGNAYVPVHVRTLEKMIAQLHDMPAPQQATPEPVCEIIADFSGHSVEYRIGQLFPGIEGLSHGTHTVFTRPTPGVPEDVQRDADRYRWLKAYDQNSEDMGICKWVDEGWSGQWVIEHDPDTAIDNARTTQKTNHE